MIIALKEITEWNTEYKQPNHTYLVDGKYVSIPTTEAFHRLLKKVAVLEQRITGADNGR